MITSKVDFEALFSSVPDLYLILDTTFTIVAVSDAYVKATLTVKNEILGRNIFDVFTDNPDNEQATGVANLRHSLINVLKTKVADTMAVQQYDIRNANHNDQFEIRFWSPINTPILDENNEVKYIIHRVVDVTEFVKLKKLYDQGDLIIEQLRTREGKMEKEIYQRAQEIQTMNKNLQDSFEKLATEKKEKEHLFNQLQDMIKLKSDMFANVSHEFRTPLTLILGHVHKLQTSYLDLQCHHEIKLIENNAKLLLKHVNDLLDLAKTDAGQAHIHYVRADLSQVLSLIAEQFVDHARERQIDYQILVPTEVIAEFDIDKIQRILLNLLSNAFKFTPDRGTVNCILEVLSNKAKISIADSGKGVAKHMRKKIFSRFQQDHTDQQFQYGTGLGLAIVKEFVELHGGTINVRQSTLGGALFIAQIPLSIPIQLKNKLNQTIHSVDLEDTFADRLASGLTSIDSNISLSPIDEFCPDKPTLLIVEDNIEVNNYIVSVLQPDFNIVRALNGEEGIEKAISFMPDLILTDLMMPVMGGEQLVYKIRQETRLDDIPIILLTAKADDEIRIRLLKKGAQDYLAKPFLAEELQVRIKNLIRLKKMKQMVDEKNIVLKQINNDLESFNRSVSHDLRNPVNIIIGFSKLLLDLPINNQLNQQFNDYINEIYLSGKKMERLITDLLTLSRISQEKIQTQSINISLMIKSILHSFHHLEQERKVEFIIKDNIYIEADFNLMQIALENILSNAWKYTSKNKITRIEFTNTKAKDQSDHHICMIKDNGVGFPNEKAHQLFRAFSRLHSENDFPGTGVGLTTVKRIIDKHGGEIWAESEVEKGAIFYFKMKASC